MPDQSTLSGLRPDDEAKGVRALALAFAGTSESVVEWIAHASRDNLRVLRDAGRPVASLVRVPMGQHFGGQSVPMLGIAGVAVPPELRGRSCAKRLMQGCIRDADDEGWPLSTLFASTHTLCRSVGYERAGHRFQCTVPAAQLPNHARGDRIVPIDDPSSDAICAATDAGPHDSTARSTAGPTAGAASASSATRSSTGSPRSTTLGPPTATSS
ncbi:MAG: GNAT family N-acetyltransferase [Phycisphaerae bacterium]|nr:GNAT family N-acetyltransferase [Phycisphaerae bacterium]